LPFIHHHVAAMPDVHWGLGATVGSVIPTRGAIIPAAVGVDIGCGMMAAKLSGVGASHLPDDLAEIRSKIESLVPVGFAQHPTAVSDPLDSDLEFLQWLESEHPNIVRRRKNKLGDIVALQLGTLGGGNHFIEICIDENNDLWVMLHSGSRGMGNIIGTYFVEFAK